MRQFLLKRRLEARPGSAEAATAVEYAIMVALVAALIVVIVTTLGLQTAGLYELPLSRFVEATAE